MHIFSIAVVILIVVFSIRVQTLLRIAGAIAATTIHGVLLRTWNAAGVSLFVLITLWVVNVATFCVVGGSTGSPWSGCVLGLLIPLWSILYVIRKISWMQSVLKPLWVVVTLLIALALPLFLFGLWSPDAKVAADAWATRSKQVLAGKFYKRALHSPAKTIKGTTTMVTGAYDANGNSLGDIFAGIRVLAAGDVPRDTSVAEPMVRVMLPNCKSEFVKGNIVYVPAEKIKWDDV